MIRTLKIALVPVILLTAAFAQTPGSRGKAEFEAASIRVNPPRTGFHLTTDAMSGGPGTNDPGLFRCASCTLPGLIAKAFELQNYQFPGRSALLEKSFDITARVPPGTTKDEFHAMLKGLLKDRFGLESHFTNKVMKGYHLVVAGNASKLKESGEGERAVPQGDAGGHGSWGAGHNGLVAFGNNASFRGDHQSMADLVKLLSDQLSVPVDDQTGLQGKYDIALNWSGTAVRSGDHADGAFGGAGHGDHGGAPGGPGADRGDVTAPTLFAALQAQLGLKLVSSIQAEVRVFVVDKVQQVPTEN